MSESKKKSVGIITYHGADNYGSVLQAYALQEALLKINSNDVTIINYVSNKQNQLYSVFFSVKSVKDVLKNIYIFFFLYNKRKNRKESFANFRHQYLNLSMDTPVTDGKKMLDSKYDAIVCGSDQIWNIRIPDFDDIYMLSFCTKAKKISYAASMGGIDLYLQGREKEDIQKLLSEFTALSVRENIGERILREVGIEDINVNIDPVFLIDRKSWEVLAAERKVFEKYIFFYSVDYNDESVEIARYFAKKYKMPVYILYSSWRSYFITKNEIKCNSKFGVTDFLSLIKNAEFVLSGSFHGSAFSLIFNKPFFRIKRKFNGVFLEDDRIHTLFEKLCVVNREISIDDYKERSDDIFDIDFAEINRRIKYEKKIGIEYLQKAISDS